jgi:hypothetical protein
VNDEPSFEFVASGHFRVADLATVERSAFGEQLGASSAMNGAVNSAAAEQ